MKFKGDLMWAPHRSSPVWAPTAGVLVRLLWATELWGAGAGFSSPGLRDLGYLASAEGQTQEMEREEAHTDRAKRPSRETERTEKTENGQTKQADTRTDKAARQKKMLERCDLGERKSRGTK